MGIIQRFADIMSANMNDLLDKCEDPSKMIDQEIRKAKEDLAEVKKETAQVMADEKAARRNYDEAENAVKETHQYAVRALQAGNEADAEKFLQQETQQEQTRDAAKAAWEQAAANADKMKQLYNKLASDIEALTQKRNTVKSTVAVARATERMNDFKVPSYDVSNRLDKWQDKANQMLDQANAELELNMQSDSPMDALRAKYDKGPDVSDKMAALRAEVGKN